MPVFVTTIISGKQGHGGFFHSQAPFSPSPLSCFSGFEHTMHSIDESRPWVTKLSSAGLVYAHYGKEVLRQVIEQNAWASADFTDASLDILYCKMYEVFVEEIDAIDNGISQTDGEKR